MTRSEAEVVDLLYRHFLGVFPKKCHRCDRVYASLHEYVMKTQAIPQAVSYDADLAESDGVPIGSTVFAKCICGNTLALSTSALPEETRLGLIAWARTVVHDRGWSIDQFLNHMRDQIRDKVIDAHGDQSKDQE